MRQTKDEVMTSMCVLMSDVRIHLAEREPGSATADCWCTERTGGYVQVVDDEVIDFIKEAVAQRIRRQRVRRRK